MRWVSCRMAKYLGPFVVYNRWSKLVISLTLFLVSAGILWIELRNLEPGTSLGLGKCFYIGFIDLLGCFFLIGFWVDNSDENIEL